MNLLCLEDNPADQKRILLLVDKFTRLSVEVHTAQSLSEAQKILSAQEIDLALVDLNLIESGPTETLAYFAKINQLAWLVISQEEDMALVKEALRLGAQDYLFKASLTAALLEKSLLYAWERHQGQMEKNRLASQSFLEQSREMAFSSTQGAYVVRTDLKGRYIFYNQRFAQTFFSGNQEMIGQDGMAHIAEEDHPKTLAAVEKCLAQPGKPIQLDLSKPQKNGQSLRTAWEFTALTDEAGQPREIQCIGIDLSALDLAEEKAVQVERQLDIIERNTSDLIALLSPGGQFQYLSPSVEQILGFKPQEYLRFPYHQQVHPEDLATVEKGLQEIHAGKELFVARYRLRHKAGQYLWVETRARGAQGENGQLAYIVTNTSPIGEMVKLQEKLRKSKEEYQQLVENAVDITYRLNPCGELDFISSQIFEQLGYQPEELLGKRFLEFCHPEDASYVLDQIEASLMQKSGLLSKPIRFRAQNGTYRYYQTNGGPVFNANGQVLYILGTARDVTEELHKQRELESTKALLEQAQEQARLGVWEYRLDNQQVYWSPAMYGLFELAEEAPSELEKIAVFHEKEAFSELMEQVEKALRAPHHFRQLMTVTTAKGATRYHQVNGQSFTNEKGKVLGLRGTTLDVTEQVEQQKAEQKQKEQMGRLAKWAFQMLGEEEKTLFDNAPHFLSSLLLGEIPVILFSYGPEQKEYTLKSFYLPPSLAFLESHFEKDRRDQQWYPSDPHLVGKLHEQEGLLPLDTLPPEAGKALLGPYPDQEALSGLNELQIYALPLRHQGELLGSIQFAIRKEQSLPEPSFLEFFAAHLSALIGEARARAALTREEKRLQLALYSAQLGIYELDQRQGLLRVDHTLAKMHGYSKEELEERQVADLLEMVHPDDRHLVQQVIQGNRPLEQANRYRFLVRSRHKAGHYFWVEENGIVLERDSQGRPQRLLATHLDCNDRMQREEQLRLLESVIKEANDGVMITDAQLDEPGPSILYLNQAMENISGYSAAELLGKNPRILQGAETREESRQEIREKLSRGETLKIDLLNYHKNGNPYWVELNISPVIDGRGKVSHFIALERDITEEKNRQQTLKETLARFQMAVQANQMGVWEYHLEEDRLLWDQTMFKLYGAKREDFKGTFADWRKCIHPEDLAPTEERFQEAIKRKETFRSQFRIRGEGEDSRYLMGLAQVIEGEEGKAERIIGLNWDITEQVQQEQKTAQALAERESIINSITDGFFAVDQEWTITVWNPSATAIMGRTAEEVLGRNLWEVFASAVGSGFYQAYHRALEKQQVERVMEYYAADQIWLKATAFPRQEGLAIFFQDVSQEVKSAQDLDRLKKSREALINATSDLIWSLDKDLHLSTANRAFTELCEKLTGKICQEGDSIMQDLPASCSIALWEKWYRKALEGEEVHQTLKAEDQKGAQWYAVSIYPILENDLTVSGIACYRQDITDRMRYLEAIEKQNQQLREIGWTQSHLVRAPLTNIMGLAELLAQEQQGNLNPEALSLLQHLAGEANHLDQILREIIGKTADVKPEQDQE